MAKSMVSKFHTTYKNTVLNSVSSDMMFQYSVK